MSVMPGNAAFWSLWSAARLAAALALCGLTACASFGWGERGSDSSTLPLTAPRTVGADTPAQRERQRILSAYGGAYQDPPLERLLDKVAKTVAAASDQPELSYRITVLNSPSVNAFALPSGDVYITRGLVSLANDTSEIAAVVAHEMGHVLARHAFARADKERQAMLVSRIVTDVLNDPNAGALAKARGRVSLARFSREQEFEADQIGVGLLAKAGYDPFGAARFLSAMERNAVLRASMLGTGDEKDLDFMASHPATPERVRLATEAAQKVEGSSSHERGRDAFLAAINGLVYGDDPAQGYLRGNRFLHPLSGFAFEAPQGFTLENVGASIVGIGADNTALRFDGVKAAPDKPLEAYLQDNLLDGVPVSGVETLVVNGLPAATATARGEAWSFRVAVIRLGDYVYRLVYAAKTYTDEVDARFKASIQTFHTLSAAEATSLRPQRLAVVPVVAGDTPQSFAARMETDSYALKRFLILNGIEADATLKPGTAVKIIVE